MKFCFEILADEPYDAKYLLLVYGQRVYDNFRALALGLTSVTYQSPPDKESDERAHMVFLVLMVILLFSDGFDPNMELISSGTQASIDHDSKRSNINRSLSTTSESTSSTASSPSPTASLSSSSSGSKLNEKLHRIKQNYIELACRYLHDEFGFSVGRRMFKDLVPLLVGKIFFYFPEDFLNFFTLSLHHRSSKIMFDFSQCESM